MNDKQDFCTFEKCRGQTPTGVLPLRLFFMPKFRFINNSESRFLNLQKTFQKKSLFTTKKKRKKNLG